jgi:hypothetical protein
MAQAYKMLPPAQDLWELFDYKPLTGELTWKNSTGAARAGAVAGTRNRINGYTCVSIKHGLYKTHRIVWCWITGTDPSSLQIDHIDGNRSNNTIHNLRLATEAENSCNSKLRTDNRSGVKGVELRSSGKYRARVVKNNKHYYLGTFDTAEQAGAAYAVAAAKLHGEFARVC